MATPEHRAESWSHRFRSTALGLGPTAEVFLEVERSDGPSLADTMHVFTVQQAQALADALLQSIKDTEEAPPKVQAPVSYPIPTADLAQHLYGFPYGEE